jgi:hypothetical protein
MRKATNTYLFPNGMVATFDKNGVQIPKLQGKYTKELHKKILDNSDMGCIWNGFSGQELQLTNNNSL